MKPSCQIVDRKDSQGFARYLAKNGQLLRPLVRLIEASIRRCFCYVEKLINSLKIRSIRNISSLLTWRTPSFTP